MIHEQTVRERAYFIWEDEGRAFGRAEAHWLRAEAELTAAQAVPAVTMPTLAPVVEASVASPAKTLKPAASRAKAKAEKAPAKAAKKAEAPKAASKVAAKVAAKPRRAPRAAESGIALH